MSGVYLPPEARVGVASLILLVLSAATLRWLHRSIDAAVSLPAGAR